MTGPLPSSIIANIRFVGRGGGQVKSLSGFKKGHHTVPDAANAVTNAFLGKICADDLTAHAEKLFQDARERLGYKRKEISLAVSSGLAVLTSRDFSVEIGYALEEASPERYGVTTTLAGLKNADLAETEEFADLFRSTFSEIAFELRRGASVEAVIDVIEALDGANGLAVTYPSDCRECVITVKGVNAQVCYAADALRMIFPRSESPRELMAAFSAVRGAFGISRELSGLIE